jgi:hypothetical protein
MFMTVSFSSYPTLLTVRTLRSTRANEGCESQQITPTGPELPEGFQSPAKIG